MKRRTLIQAIRTVEKAVRESGLESIHSAARHTAEEARKPFFIALPKFLSAAAHFGKAEQAILAITGLNELLDPEFLVRATDSKDTWGWLPDSLYGGLRASLNTLPKLATILEQDVDDAPRNATARIILPTTNDKAYSKVDRLIAALESVRDLYHVCAKLNNEDANSLAVAACDSGSDVEIVVMGAPVAILALKSLIASIYQMWAFHRQNQMLATQQVVASHLPVLEAINKSAQNSKISPEEAQQLRDKINNSVPRMIDAGVITEDIEKNTHGEAKRLMAPAPKLLTGPPEKESQESQQATDHESFKDTVAKMRELLKTAEAKLAESEPSFGFIIASQHVKPATPITPESIGEGDRAAEPGPR